ncbi:SWIM zinc finger family protein [Scytonema hofmannii FACHB-248]|uniref:SWIM zinc finger family protein n=1 Tax=Scytonema hofmannii FACHB-248 TaxID=1842502 RepID=A0ABR8GVV8_9CYAN|nr:MULTISPECIES: SWIM zinc finger family protein [Nostocales]MBD2607287.1 SWIM zinc finger family protein [Scytonema hofmannii FACHB-248]
MSPIWTQEQILALATDTSSAKNAQALAVRSKWLSLGYNQQAIWGECQGSGSNPYQTQINLRELAFKCNCPSQKTPCKHAIGLFLLFADEKDAFTEKTLPQETSLDTPKYKSDNKTESTKKVVDTVAQAKRAQMRYNKVTAGMQDLELWLRDLVRQGLAVAQGQPYSFWDTAGARLVDAQAPGVARMLREIGSIPHSGIGWEERLLTQLGRVYLLISGFKRLETFPAEMQADIRTQIGWTQQSEELLTSSGMRDRWLILGQRVTEEDKLRSQFNWLWGEQSQQPALILNFAYGSQPLDNSLIPGTSIDAELVFFESAYPLRSLVKIHHDAAQSVEKMPGFSSIQHMMQAYAKALARNPWIEQFPVALQAVMPVFNDDGNFCGVRDADGYMLSTSGLSSQQTWQLLALSGGHAVGIFGEWNGDRFLPLSVYAENVFFTL